MLPNRFLQVMENKDKMTEIVSLFMNECLSQGMSIHRTEMYLKTLAIYLAAKEVFQGETNSLKGMDVVKNFLICTNESINLC